MVSLYYKIRSVKIKRGSGGVNTRILLPHTRVDSIDPFRTYKGSKTCHATPAHQHKVAQVQNQDATRMLKDEGVCVGGITNVKIIVDTTPRSMVIMHFYSLFGEQHGINHHPLYSRCIGCYCRSQTDRA